MDIVVDANVIMSSLIAQGSGITSDLLFSDVLTIFAPEYLLDELKEHQEEILRKSGLSPEDLQTLLSLLILQIHIFSFEEYEQFLPLAEETCPDPDDLAYFAVALHRNCPLWSNDNKLKEQEAVKVYSTTDLITFLSGK